MIGTHKVIQVTPAFAPAAMFDVSRARLTFTPGVVDEKWVLLNKYPLPSVWENERDLKAAAHKWGYTPFDSGDDLGLHGSLNNFLAHHPQPHGTILIGVDSDSGTDADGWDLAIAETLAADDSLAIVSLGFAFQRAPEHEIHEIAGRRVWVHPSTDMVNITGYDLDSILAIGGFDQPVKYWGGLESQMIGPLKRLGKSVGYLVDYLDARPAELAQMRDPRYCEWKMKAYQGQVRGGFAEYLEAL